MQKFFNTEQVKTYTQVARSRDPQDNKKILNGYKIIKNIGEGAYGKIKLAIRVEDNQEYAIKKFNKFILRKKTKIQRNPDGTTKYVTLLSEVEREIELQCKLNHPNVVKVYEILDDIDNDKLYIVMEHASKGTLLDWNHKTQLFSYSKDVPLQNESYLKKIFSQCLIALNYLHQNLIVHRDIKPQNILIDFNGNVKICDFGCAVTLSSPEARLKGTEGTFQFMAPECLKENKLEKSGFLGQMADVWSLGVVMYCVITLKLPFSDDNMMQLFNKIQNNNPVLQSQNYSVDMINLVQSMINKQPNERPTVEQLIELIKNMQ